MHLSLHFTAVFLLQNRSIGNASTCETDDGSGQIYKSNKNVIFGIVHLTLNHGNEGKSKRAENRLPHFMV